MNRKKKDMMHEVNKFKTLYSYEINDNYTLANALTDFEENNNSRIAIFSPDGKVKMLPNYQKGLDDLNSLTYFCSEIITNKELIYDTIYNNKTHSFTFLNSGNTKIAVVAPMSLSESNDSLVISVSSVQPITEASMVVLEFYKNIMLAFIILGIFLSFLYSKIITIPLLKINKVADKMSRLDFSEKCEVQSNDELGNLASTLNFLSIKLSNSLEDLKEKNKQLTKEIEIEKKTEKLRKDFITGVSHELKTPVSLIEGYAEGLKDGIVEGRDAEIYIETILDEAKKMNDLICNMLEISKFESGFVNLNIESFNILRMIKGKLTKLEYNLQKKNLKVSINTKLPYIYVLGDIFNIELVISNLLTNAIKYTPDNKQIKIFFKDLKSKWEISIENTGSHIPEDEIDNLFKKFYKIDKSRNRNDKSSGLGLSIVKNILDLHDSSYSILNTKDGVLFKFTLNKSYEHK